MKKILVIYNDLHVPHTALNLAIQLASNEGATIYGLFVQNLENEGNKSYLFPNDLALTAAYDLPGKERHHKLQYEQTNMKLFADTCATANVPFKTHTLHNNFLDALLDQSTFADLVVCDADTSPAEYSMKTFLANANCPVLLVNKDYKQTDNLVFTYDDKTSSIHSVKMFTYLFPFFRQLPVHFVSVVAPDVLGIEYADLIKEWLPLHYKDAQINLLKGDPREELPRYINNLSNPLVVMGAFGRSSFSRFFKESLANIILERTNAPIFIAHE